MNPRGRALIALALGARPDLAALAPPFSALILEQFRRVLQRGRSLLGVLFEIQCRIGRRSEALAEAIVLNERTRWREVTLENSPLVPRRGLNLHYSSREFRAFAARDRMLQVLGWQRVDSRSCCRLVDYHQPRHRGSIPGGNETL